MLNNRCFRLLNDLNRSSIHEYCIAMDNHNCVTMVEQYSIHSVITSAAARMRLIILLLHNIQRREVHHVVLLLSCNLPTKQNLGIVHTVVTLVGLVHIAVVHIIVEEHVVLESCTDSNLTRYVELSRSANGHKSYRLILAMCMGVISILDIFTAIANFTVSIQFTRIVERDTVLVQSSTDTCKDVQSEDIFPRTREPCVDKVKGQIDLTFVHHTFVHRIANIYRQG